MFEPRRRAGDGEKGRGGRQPYAERPSRRTAAKIGKFGGKACDVCLVRFERDELCERRCGGFRLLTAQRRACRGNAMIDPTLLRAELDPLVGLSGRGDARRGSLWWCGNHTRRAHRQHLLT